MSSVANELLRNTIDALARLDAERLEALAAEAERCSGTSASAGLRLTVEVRALRDSLLEVLRTTDENRRLLRGLHQAQLRGLAAQADVPSCGGVAWGH